jgi:nucleotide-binding universal stress UspA family protein
MSAIVLAAVDLGPFSGRVLRHASGFARLLQAEMKVLHVTPDPQAGVAARVLDSCTQQGPYEVDLAEEDLLVRAGHVSDVIYREAQRLKSALIVIGSRGHGGLARRLLGSTSEAVLRNAPAPILLVPPTDLEIVNVTDRVRLTTGPILAAIDLAEHSETQLQMASDMAALAAQPLLFMTVAPSKVDDHLAGAILRERAHQLTTVKPHALIVRRGRVAEEISRCALNEGAGLVVMGLRERARGQPGTVAAAVLATRRAFVLAVPRARDN